MKLTSMVLWYETGGRVGVLRVEGERFGRVETRGRV